MPGAYWYYGLIIASFVLFTASLIYRKDWKLLVLHLSLASVIHPLEILIFTTDGYHYYPNIMRPSADDFMGAYISDFFIVPASAVAINAFALSWPSKLCIAAIFTGIDWFFNDMGIYRHYWWKSIYTGFGLVIFYTISGWLWNGLQKCRQELPFRLLVIHLTYFAMQSAITFAANQGGQLFKMQIKYLDFIDDRYAMALALSLYQIIVSATVVLSIGLKMPLRYRTQGIAVIVALNWAIAHFGIFQTQADITSQHLILIPIISITLLKILFRAAKIDYLFPRSH